MFVGNLTMAGADSGHLASFLTSVKCVCGGPHGRLKCGKNKTGRN